MLYLLYGKYNYKKLTLIKTKAYLLQLTCVLSCTELGCPRTPKNLSHSDVRLCTSCVHFLAHVLLAARIITAARICESLRGHKFQYVKNYTLFL